MAHHRWALPTTFIVWLALMGGTPIFAAGIAVGGFVGEPSGFSLVYIGDDGGWVANVGRSTRGDGGPDISGALWIVGFQMKKEGALRIGLLTGPGLRVSFLDHTEYSVVLPVEFLFGFGHGHHQGIYVDVGPSFAFYPETNTSLFAAVGYRYTVKQY